VQEIEQATRRPDRWSVLHQLAEALGVEVVEITGRPYRHEKADLDSGHAAVPELRLALQHALMPASAPDREVRPCYELEAEVLRAEQLRQARQPAFLDRRCLATARISGVDVHSVMVAGMSCEHCATAVRAEISSLPGVTRVDVDVASGEVRIAGEALPDDAALRAAIETAGYEMAG